MAEVLNEQAQLRVGAHVLVQLGSELVTDAEQAILECVKNAYDADSPGCSIVIDTRERGTRREERPRDELEGFTAPFPTVAATLVDGSVPGTAVRLLSYRGRITIEDHGGGIPDAAIAGSWLVVSRSAKRSAVPGPKRMTAGGRTPLGDKGLGRLGTMKLGDVLLVETATAPDEPLLSAQFRWTDCESAATVDQIPVSRGRQDNAHGFKGTRVSVLGLRDLGDWERKDRGAEIAASLAKLISPFEATSAFPVRVLLDDVEHDLSVVTNEALGFAVAEFEFEWGPEAPGGPNVLRATGRLRKRLLAGERSDSQRERTRTVFGEDGGARFAAGLKDRRRLRGYAAVETDPDGAWFVTLQRRFADSPLAGAAGTVVDPGPFRGAFYYFNLLRDEGGGNASGTGLNVELVRNMAGIAVLRDGFTVRSQGDWLNLARGMTSGSTYNLRPENTVGYFALTGRDNFRLTEKSDREGFVEDAAFRGFLRIAEACRDFANAAMVNVRRSVDEFHREREDAGPAGDMSAAGALGAMRARLESMAEARGSVRALTLRIHAGVDRLEADGPDGARFAADAREALAALERTASKLDADVGPDLLVGRVDRELSERRERTVQLLESAAVGLSARGLTHELRTHLAEIRQQAAALEKEGAAARGATVRFRAIRRSCAAISQAASLVDPLLPRSRTVKETFGLREFVRTYFEGRSAMLGRFETRWDLVGADARVRINRPRLLQVLDNLVRNSLFWMRRAGTPPADRLVTIEVTSSGFVLSDTGPGVDPHVEETLFDLFVTTKQHGEGGQGLGLYISSELLALNGCAISLMSDRNAGGRRFRFLVDLTAVRTGG